MPFRSCLTLLLLLNYLLVVGAGLVGRPAPPPVEHPFAYVHSHDCQQKNYLRLACFDDCNGVQYTVQKQGQKMPFQQLLTTFKGVDLHCLPEVPARPQTPMFGRKALRWAAQEPAVVAGFWGRIYSPPRRG